MKADWSVVVGLMCALRESAIADRKYTVVIADGLGSLSQLSFRVRHAGNNNSVVFWQQASVDPSLYVWRHTFRRILRGAASHMDPTPAVALKAAIAKASRYEPVASKM